MQTVSPDLFRDLLNLRELDLSNNRIRNLPDTCFHFLKKLRRLEMQDNIVDEIHKGTFQVYYLNLHVGACKSQFFLRVIGRHSFEFERRLFLVQQHQNFTPAHVRGFDHFGAAPLGRQQNRDHRETRVYESRESEAPEFEGKQDIFGFLRGVSKSAGNRGLGHVLQQPHIVRLRHVRPSGHFGHVPAER